MIVQANSDTSSGIGASAGTDSSLTVPIPDHTGLA